MGFQSFGSNPHWTRYNSKPKESCAVSGNRLTSSLLPPPDYRFHEHIMPHLASICNIWHKRLRLAKTGRSGESGRGTLACALAVKGKRANATTGVIEKHADRALHKA